LRTGVNTGRALDALLRVYDGNDSFQVAEDIVRAGVDAFTTILAKAL
jgi:hypothetical protein